MTEPSAQRIPATKLLDYFRSTLCKAPLGKGQGRLSEVARWNDRPAELARLFGESVDKVEREYRNHQPFYPIGHTFGMRGKTSIRHGDELRFTVDVAARLEKAPVWRVERNAQLDFRYLDRELPLARAKPTPKQDPGSLLEVDLFLANAYDRMPILCELKIRKDQCAFYALIQLLTQAAYAVTTSQRERLVLFGSQPDCVLREALPGEPAAVDLYVLLVESPGETPYPDLRDASIALSEKLIADERVGSRIGRIAWIEGKDAPRGGLRFAEVAVASSSLRRPRRTPVPPPRG